MSREIYTVSVVSKILVALQMVGTTYTGNPAPSLARCPPAELFSQSPGIANLKSLLFRDPACFTAGNIHNHFMRRNLCFPNMALPLGLLIFWISCEGVKIEGILKVSRQINGREFFFSTSVRFREFQVLPGFPPLHL